MNNTITQPPLPNTIRFQHTINNDKTEVMRITREGIWVNPDMAADETAKAVLDALDSNIKVLVKSAVAAEREACAKTCEETRFPDSYTAIRCAAAIRARGEK